MTLTEKDIHAVEVIRRLVESSHDRTFTPTELGERLWPDEHRKPQCFARPAGSVIKRLMAAGYVKRTIRTRLGGRYCNAYRLLKTEVPPCA